MARCRVRYLYGLIESVDSFQGISMPQRPPSILVTNLWTIHQVREPESSSPENVDPEFQGYLLV